MLADEIEKARQRQQIAALDSGESAFANFCVAAELARGDVELLKPWLAWCEEKSVRHAPAKPWVVAAFVLDRHQNGVALQSILDCLTAIERLHDHWRLANPVASLPVQEVLERIIDVPAPRSWTKDERRMFPLIPLPLREAVHRRDRDRELKIRQLQNEVADLKKQLKPDGEAVEQKETTNESIP
jgi:hypothetical protein